MQRQDTIAQRVAVSNAAPQWMRDIRDEVLGQIGITLEELLSDGRSSEMVAARQQIGFMLRVHKRRPSYPQIARVIRGTKKHGSTFRLIEREAKEREFPIELLDSEEYGSMRPGRVRQIPEDEWDERATQLLMVLSDAGEPLARWQVVDRLQWTRGAFTVMWRYFRTTLGYGDEFVDDELGVMYELTDRGFEAGQRAKKEAA